MKCNVHSCVPAESAQPVERSKIEVEFLRDFHILRSYTLAPPSPTPVSTKLAVVSFEHKAIDGRRCATDCWVMVWAPRLGPGIGSSDESLD